jgi:sulfotransferase
MKKQFYFISGLPRSGSTLLANILAQNPRFHTTSTSGLSELVLGIRNSWDRVPEFLATPNEGAKKRIMGGIFDLFYGDIEKPVVFDKSRVWPSAIETLEEVLGQKVKIIVTVRDVRDILTSFELLWRENKKLNYIRPEANNLKEFETLRGRCAVWTSQRYPVGLAYDRITDAYKRGLLDRMCLVDFDDLTSKPNETMADVYKFLGEEMYQHNFENVEQKTQENDFFHGINGLHQIRNKVEPVPSRWRAVLGEEFERYGRFNFWKRLSNL